MDKFIEFGVYIREFNFLSICVRFIMAVIIGGIIGSDRSRKKRAAGLKTHILVCLSSTLIMTLSLYINEKFETSGDITRLGAQVISGIGFLGAGTIVLTGDDKVKGLTTAASLWACGCIGLSLGVGFYEGAIISSALIIVVMTKFQNSNEYFQKNSQTMKLDIEIKNIQDLTNVVDELKESKAKIVDIQLYESVDNETTNLSSKIKFNKYTNHDEIIKQLNKFDGITVKEINELKSTKEI